VKLRGVLIALAAAALLAACARPSDTPASVPTDETTAGAFAELPPPQPLDANGTAATVVPEVDRSCTVASDCTVKNIGNCCGYYPGCVNKGSPTFPELVAQQCAEQDMAGICGFPEIRACACIEGRCEPSDAETM
jgi:hypothetical protein